MPDPGVRQPTKKLKKTPRRVAFDTDQEIIDYLSEALGKKDDDEKSALEDEFDDEFFWQDAVIGRIKDDIKAVSKAYDVDVSAIDGWFNGQQTNLLKYLNGFMVKAGTTGYGGGPEFYTGTPQGINQLFTLARGWVGLQFPAFNELINGMGNAGGGGGGGGGGRGPRKPTAAEIRAQFDVDQMVSAINDMSRGLVLAEEKNARSIANGYINAIVANPEQELDFETFVRNKILGSARAKVIYAGKPESLSHEQFLQPYVQAFQQMAGPGFGDQLSDVATAGARLNADPNAYRARLERTSQVQASSPFLNKLGERMAGIRGVLRG